MARPSVQQNLPPMEILRVGTAPATSTDPVGTAFDPVDSLVKAISGAGLNQLQAAQRMDIDKTTFSKGVSPHEPAFNSFMKKIPHLGTDIARAWVEGMARDLGLTLAGPDAERRAEADLIAAAAGYIRVVAR